MQQGLADIPNRKILTTTVKDDGTFIFKEMPKLKYQIQIDLMHFCWQKEKLRVTYENENIKN